LTGTTFEETLRALEGVEGWLTEAQARRLWERAGQVEAPARIVEIGSYRGRSAILLARAADGRVAIVAIDPHAGNDRGPQQVRGSIAEGEADNLAFRANLERAGVSARVEHVRLRSRAALAAVEGPAQLVYVDGSHSYGPARDDIVGWGRRVPPGGVLLIHDAWSSVGVTLALVRTLVFGSRFRYAGRTGSLAEYVCDEVGRTRPLNAARQLAELPWFARNLVVKVAILTGLRPLARLLGHRSQTWPY
jgi:Methyltransferase domain